MRKVKRSKYNNNNKAFCHYGFNKYFWNSNHEEYIQYVPYERNHELIQRWKEVRGY